MNTVQINSDVDVNDVAIEQHAIVRNAVTDHFVHTRAHALWVPVIVQRAWVATHFNREVMNEDVDLIGGDARAHHLAGATKNFCSSKTSNTHALDDLRSLHTRLIVAWRVTGLCIWRLADGVGYVAHWADDAGLNTAFCALAATLVFTATSHQHGSFDAGRVSGT